MALSEDSISTILESTEGTECRMLLCEVSKDHQKVNFKLLAEAILKINEYVWDRTEMINALPQHDPIFNYWMIFDITVFLYKNINDIS